MTNKRDRTESRVNENSQEHITDKHINSIKEHPTESSAKSNHNVSEPTNPFRISDFVLKGDPRARAATQRVYISIDVRKPNQEEFFMVRVDDYFRTLYRTSVSLLRYKRDFYLITPGADLDVPAKCRVEAVVYACINRQDDLFAWPVPLLDSRGNRNSFYDTAHDAAVAGMEYWTLIESGDRSYTNQQAANPELAPPMWPKELDGPDGPDWFYGLAFKQRIVNGMDHPVARQIVGLE